MASLSTLLRQRKTQGDPLWMGIVNTTPDSFSDGGCFLDAKSACERVDVLLGEGADVIDIGGESTRPGSSPVDGPEQLRRLGEPVRHAVRSGAIVSVDTTLVEVAKQALEWGVQVINDVSCLGRGDDLAVAAAEGEAHLIIMHSRGGMSSMEGYSRYAEAGYGDVVADVLSEWTRSALMAEQVGIPRDRVWLDPGIGFHKNGRQSMELVARSSELVELGYPVVLGPSRKSFLATQVSAPPDRRLGGTIITCVQGARKGVNMLRVHDILEARQAWAVTKELDRLAANAGRLND